MKKAMITFLITLFFSPVLFSIEIAGVKVPDSITAGETRLALNGAGTRTKYSSSKVNIKGLEFKKALFGIWLCDKPAQKSLKQEMLGK